MSSGKSTKAKNREVRRAFGQTVVDLMAAHEHKLKEHSAIVKASMAHIQTLQREIEALEVEVKNLLTLRAVISKKLASFGGRVRWFFLG